MAIRGVGGAVTGDCGRQRGGLGAETGLAFTVLQPASGRQQGAGVERGFPSPGDQLQPFAGCVIWALV